MERLPGLGAALYFASHAGEPLIREALAAYEALLRTIGDAVRRHQDDRNAILADLWASSDPPFLDEDIKLVDMPLAGLRGPAGTFPTRKEQL